MSRQPKFLQHTTSNIVNSSTSKGRVHTGMNDLAVRASTWAQEAGMGQPQMAHVALDRPWPNSPGWGSGVRKGSDLTRITPLRTGWWKINAKKCRATQTAGSEWQNKRVAVTVSLNLPCLLEDFSLVSLKRFSFYLVYILLCLMVITHGCPRDLCSWEA